MLTILTHSRRTTSVHSTVCAVAACLLLTSLGCSPPELQSQGLEIARALDSALELHSTEQLQQAETLIAEALQQGSLNAAEAKSLRAIITSGQSGQWDNARQQNRALLARQNDW